MLTQGPSLLNFVGTGSCDQLPGLLNATDKFLDLPGLVEFGRQALQLVSRPEHEM